tara:strand:+ start:428 stop:622 length:195 start_codon:yes stop_codon:yes gene_type:complete
MTIRSAAIYRAKEAYRLNVTRGVINPSLRFHQDHILWHDANGYIVALKDGGSVDTKRTKAINNA